MELATARFWLRDFTDNDRRAFLAYQTDPGYRALSETDAVPADELLRQFEQWRLANPRRNYQLAVVRRDTEELVGCCGLRGIDGHAAELGIELAAQHWGRYRYAVEIAEALLSHGFEMLDLREIYGITTAQNARVARLARWFGGTTTAAAHRGPNQVEWRIGCEGWRDAARTRRWRSID